MRDFLAWRVAPYVSAFCVIASAATSAIAQEPAAPVAAPPPPSAPPPAPPPAAAPAPTYAYPPPATGYAYPAYPPPPQQLRMADSAPYSGGPVPRGYHLEERPRHGLVTGGTVMLAVPYGLGLAIAGGQDFPNGSGWLIVPGIGPWLTLLARHKANCGTSSDFESCDDSGTDDVTRTFLILDGMLQTAGAVMLIAGIAAPKIVIARDFVGNLQFVPSTMGRDGYGGFLTGTF